MTADPIEARYRILAANFSDSERGLVWRERLEADLRPALDLLVGAFGTNLALKPKDLDREHLRALLVEILPGRMGGREAFARDLPDLLEDFLVFVAREEGVASEWEWTSAVDQNREAFTAALTDEARPRFAGRKAEPHRRPGTKLGRNDPCPCGSGKKYKNCCARLA